MPAVAEVLALSVLWLIALVRLSMPRRTRQRTIGALVFLFLALAATLGDQTVRHAIDEFSGVADLSILLGHLSALLCAIMTLELTAAIIGSRHRVVRYNQATLGSAMLLLVALFQVIPRRLDHPDFGLWQARHEGVIAYQTMLQACLAIWLFATVTSLVPHWRSARRGPLKTALLLLWVGAATGLLYVASRMWYVVTHGLGIRTPIEGPVYGAATSLLFSMALLASGASGLVWVANRWRRYLHRAVGHHRLHGLWILLTHAVPGTILEPPPHPLIAIFSVRSAERLLYRRMVEIRDAQLELASYVPAGLRDAAAAALRDKGLGSPVALDACTLTIALRMAHDGADRTENSSGLSWPTDADLDGELNDLLALARMMRTPTVTDTASTVLVNGLPAGTPHHR